jgi:hypothetical protein
VTTPIERVPWDTYYFVKEGDGEYSSHTTMWRGMIMAFIIYIHAKDRDDKCAYIPHPPRKAPVAGRKAGFDKYKDCLECDREVVGLNK